MIKFKVVIIDARQGIVKTEVYKVVEPRFVPSGYCGNEYIRHAGVYSGYTELIGTLDGFLTSQDEIEWRELLS